MIKYMSDDSFIGKYQRLIKNAVIPYQHKVLFDKEEGAEKSHVAMNFVNAAKALKGEKTEDGFFGMVFQDSDAYKWLEAAAYSLVNYPDEDLERKADEMVDLISAAQDTDGYLQTYFTIKDREKRWTNLQEAHELYCSGHMMEAAVAYYTATGKKKILDVALKNMECIYRHFITDANPGYPGHPEIELALMRLYHLTKQPHALELAKHFINVRGADPGYYKKEAAARNWFVWGADPADPAYMQADMPVREQTDAKGHAVRAVYLYTAMADMAAETNDEALKQAADRLWQSITERKMYITGGIGQTVLGEAFGPDYYLPSDTAYCETCASVGLMFFARRLLEAGADRKYADVMERAFYNTVLAGLSLDGKSFFYVNPLEAIPGVSGIAPTHRHALTRRFKWHACACCPPNAARLIASFGRYAFGEKDDTAFIHMYAGGRADFENGLGIEIKTAYPFEKSVSINVVKGSGRLAVRIPAFADNASINKNGSGAEYETKRGYAYIQAAEGDEISVKFEYDIVYNHASQKVSNLAGLTAVSLGPLVYCFEEADNAFLSDIALKPGKKAELFTMKEGVLKGIPALKIPAVKREGAFDTLYGCKEPTCSACEAVAVPYYSWCNREEGAMKVWMTV
jgi:DUF1680 family protein